MPTSKTQGFTLFEVVVSLSLLSLLLLSLEALELFSLQKRLNTHYTHLAYRQLHNMEERLHMLQGQENYQLQEEAWNVENRELLPLGRGEVSGSYPSYQLKLCWGKQNQETKRDQRKCLSKSFTLRS